MKNALQIHFEDMTIIITKQKVAEYNSNLTNTNEEFTKAVLISRVPINLKI